MSVPRAGPSEKDRGGLGAAARPEFGPNVLEVLFDGAVINEQQSRDFAVRTAGRQESKDLALALGQGPQAHARFRSLFSKAYVVERGRQVFLQDSYHLDLAR